MIYSLYPLKDATIYEYYDSINTGLDSILEVSKDLDNSCVSRALLQFNLTYQSASAYYLRLQQSSIIESPISYSIAIHPVSCSWDMGTGKYNELSAATASVSWEYSGVNAWQTGSYQSNYTGSYKTNAGGGVWNYQIVATQSFNYDQGDIYTNVSNIVDYWVSSSNNGLIIKFPDNFEYLDNDLNTSLKFYAKESHTIFKPRLDVCWDDSIFQTGSLTQLISGSVAINDINIYVPNLKETYIYGSINKLQILGREKYGVRTFVTASNYNTVKYLPSNLLYSIIDESANFTVIPFSSLYTKVSCDTSGNYINLYTANLIPNRLYKIIFAIDDNYFDNNFLFSVNG